MLAANLCAAFGISKTTGAAKSKVVRDALAMRQMDPQSGTIPAKWRATHWPGRSCSMGLSWMLGTCPVISNLLHIRRGLSHIFQSGNRARIDKNRHSTAEHLRNGE